MVRNRIFYGLWLLLWLLVWGLGQNSLPACILLGSILAATLELLLTHLALRHLAFSLSAPLCAQKAQPVTVQLHAVNGSPLSCAAVTAHLSCRNLLTGQELSQSLRFGAAGHSSTDHTAVFTPDRCGKLAFFPESVRVYDLFGLYGASVPCTAQTFCLVLPQLYPVTPLLSERMSAQPDSDAYSPHRPGDDPSETFALREYLPGDSLRSIHWKLSEKTDALLVRQLGLPVQRSLLILMDNCPADLPTAAAREALGEVTASVCAALCAEGVVHTLGWFDHRQSRIVSAQLEIDNDLTQVLSTLLSADVIPDHYSAGRRLQEERGTLDYAHTLIITLRSEPEELHCSGELRYLHLTGQLPRWEEGIYVVF